MSFAVTGVTGTSASHRAGLAAASGNLKFSGDIEERELVNVERRYHATKEVEEHISSLTKLAAFVGEPLAVIFGHVAFALAALGFVGSLALGFVSRHFVFNPHLKDLQAQEADLKSTINA